MIAVGPDENKKDKQVCNHTQTYYRCENVMLKKNFVEKFLKSNVMVSD